MKALLFAVTTALTVAVCAPVFGATDGTGAQAPQTVAGAPAPGSSVVAAKGPADPNQLICKTVEVTGSHLGSTRTCRTRAVWDEIARAAREDTERFQNSDTGTNVPH